jgi:OmpA-OmpF porin, OOP family
MQPPPNARSRRSRRRLGYPLSALIALSLLAWVGPASAQRTGFAVNRFEPAERGSQLFVNDTLDFRGHMRPALGATLDYGFKPLVVYDVGGTERSALVRHQLFTHIGGSVVLGDRMRLGLNLPVAIYQDGESSIVNVEGVNERFRPADKAAIGDVRLAADVRLVGVHGDAFTLAGGLRAWVPTGQRAQFTGDGSARIAPQLLAAGDVGTFTYAARLALVYRTRDDTYAGNPLGSELAGAAGFGLRTLERKLVIGPEIFTSTVFTDQRGFFKTAGTPAEWLFGLHYEAGDVRVGGGVGGGLTTGPGAPQLRALLSLEMILPHERPDRDLDEVFDDEDACPNDAGVRDPDPRKNGCPLPKPPPDGDHDGVIDSEDACPTEAGPRSDDPNKSGCPDRDKDDIIDTLDACPDVPGVKDADPKKNGCPADRDGDGVPDSEDACVDVAGVKSADPKKNGCPPDSDGDGVLDADDACPDVPGRADPDPKKNGCPLVQLVAREIKITQDVKFKTGSAEILPESDTVLGAVKEVLETHPELKKVRVEGHTDNVGTAATNKTLSQKRAASVMKWLTDKGIDKKRLTAEGFGQDKPIDTNETEAGRTNNRRVAFTILEGEGVEKPAPAPTPPQ